MTGFVCPAGSGSEDEVQQGLGVDAVEVDGGQAAAVQADPDLDGTAGQAGAADQIGLPGLAIDPLPGGDFPV